MTGSVVGVPSAAAMNTVAAVGVQRAAWLLLVFPLAGVGEVGGLGRTEGKGHVAGLFYAGFDATGILTSRGFLNLPKNKDKPALNKGIRIDSFK